jgi:hypothetical protein
VSDWIYRWSARHKHPYPWSVMVVVLSLVADVVKGEMGCRGGYAVKMMGGCELMEVT